VLLELFRNARLKDLLFLDRPLPKPLAIGDTYQIKDLPIPVVNGNFDVVVTNETTGLQTTRTIKIDLQRLGADTTWNDGVSQLNSIPNLGATLTSVNSIRIQSTVREVTFGLHHAPELDVDQRDVDLRRFRPGN
jgi:hypothetical protein